MRPLPALIAVAALLAPLPAMAQQWFRVSGSTDMRSYVDLASLRTEGDRVLATEMVVYRTQMNNTELKWGRTTAEYRCKDRKVHFLSFEAFSASGLIGKLDDPDQGEWKTAGADSAGRLGMDFICNVSRVFAVAVTDPLTDWEQNP